MVQRYNGSFDIEHTQSTTSGVTCEARGLVTQLQRNPTNNRAQTHALPRSQASHPRPSRQGAHPRRCTSFERRQTFSAVSPRGAPVRTERLMEERTAEGRQASPPVLSGTTRRPRRVASVEYSSHQTHPKKHPLLLHLLRYSTPSNPTQCRKRQQRSTCGRTLTVFVLVFRAGLSLHGLGLRTEGA